jgi:pyrroloquinoline quinone (PQQ) biosynthesis protein C
MESNANEYVKRRVYGVTRRGDGAEIRLANRLVDLGKDEYEMYTAVTAWVDSPRPREELARGLGISSARLDQVVTAFCRAGLLYRPSDLAAAATGADFHAVFSDLLESWLAEAFSHPFWARMLEGRGSRRLFAGWLIELYHYTRNANRHMPLSCAHTTEKAIKLLRAKHYAEEWNHYHYFTKSLKALGFPESEIATSVPLPMTQALSNFMRQAAREDVLAYSICSAVLEGTTTDRKTYDTYYKTTAGLYDIPREAIAPIYAHLDLDVQYQHSDLFREILLTVGALPRERQTRILQYGHQLAELIWAWTDCIEKYYEDDANPMPRRPFDPFRD